DKHGFLVIPEEDEARIVEAAAFMDANECNSVIRAARSTSGKTTAEMLASFNEAGAAFGKAAKEKFGAAGEW
ncbi:MAG: RraA family protein, partial [Spirochaetota bacterium]